MDTPTPNKIRVLVVDDSVVIRHAIAKALQHDSEIEVVGGASNPYEARDLILLRKPHVITLDIEMPRMDGISFLQVLMSEHPLPVIMLSSLTDKNSPLALQALELGAVDVIEKPTNTQQIANLGHELALKIKAAAHAKLRPLRAFSAPQKVHYPIRTQCKFGPNAIILLGASTGGTEALSELLSELPQQMPGICVVQHIPPVFSKAFAKRLDSQCALSVKEAQDNDAVEAGVVLIAPGDYHMILVRSGLGYRINLKKGPPVWHQRPAVDLLFQSAAQIVGNHAIGALLTGMGKDGAAGLLELKNTGSTTIAQDQDTCVVFGMPKAAIEIGAAQRVLPLPQIGSALIEWAAHCTTSGTNVPASSS